MLRYQEGLTQVLISLPPNVCGQTLSCKNMDVLFSVIVIKDSLKYGTNMNALHQACFTLIN